MSPLIQAVRGMNDILPDETPLWEYFEQTTRDWLLSYGYRNIRLPIVEHTDLFIRTIGEVTDIVAKEMYTFVDNKNGESLTLRPEGTASCVRAVLEHNLLYQAPQRLYYTGPMFRHERPQKGRYRQFHQIGVEALGYIGPDVDAEHIAMTHRLWKQLQLGGVKLQINSLGSSDTRARYREKIVRYFSGYKEKLNEEARTRLEKNPLRLLDSKDPDLQTIIEGAPQLLDDIDDASREHFSQLQRMLGEMHIDFEINPRLVRGLDYYNSTVFEWVSDKLGAQGTFCAGGRYDGLVEMLGGKPAPACGYAIGIERVLALCAHNELAAQIPDAYIVHAGEGVDRYAMCLAETLRDHDLKILLHAGGGSFKAQMKKADLSAARYAIIVGENEVAMEKLTIKPLRASGPQQTLTLPETIQLLRKQHA